MKILILAAFFLVSCGYETRDTDSHDVDYGCLDCGPRPIEVTPIPSYPQEPEPCGLENVSINNTNSNSNTNTNSNTNNNNNHNHNNCSKDPSQNECPDIECPKCDPCPKCKPCPKKPKHPKWPKDPRQNDPRQRRN